MKFQMVVESSEGDGENSLNELNNPDKTGTRVDIQLMLTRRRRYPTLPLAGSTVFERLETTMNENVYS